MHITTMQGIAVIGLILLAFATLIVRWRAGGEFQGTYKIMDDRGRLGLPVARMEVPKDLRKRNPKDLDVLHYETMTDEQRRAAGFVPVNELPADWQRFIRHSGKTPQTAPGRGGRTETRK